MQNYPAHIEEKLGVDQIRERVAAFCYGPLGKSLARKAAFSNRRDLLLVWLGQVREWMGILSGDEVVPEGHYLDLRSSLDKLRIEGYFLQEEEFHNIRLLLRTIDSVTRFMVSRKEEYPLLFDLVKEVAPQRKLIQEIERVIDDEGKMRSNASPELSTNTSLRERVSRR